MVLAGGFMYYMDPDKERVNKNNEVFEKVTHDKTAFLYHVRDDRDFMMSVTKGYDRDLKMK